MLLTTTYKLIYFSLTFVERTLYLHLQMLRLNFKFALTVISYR